MVLRCCFSLIVGFACNLELCGVRTTSVCEEGAIRAGKNSAAAYGTDRNSEL